MQAILDEAGIPFFMGPEKATGVDKRDLEFLEWSQRANHANRFALGWAAMQHYKPEDDPTPKETAELEEVAVRCPKCHSEEVVFEGRTSSQEKPRMTLPKNTNGAAILAAINGKTMALRKRSEDELVVSTPLRSVF